MEAIPEAVLEEIVARLAEALHPERIYLFGSYAYGTPHADSDLDFLVVVPDDAGDRWELAVQGRAALRGMRIPIDVVVFPRSEMEKWRSVRSSLPHAVTRKGKLVYAA